jgi:hypothetical protein
VASHYLGRKQTMNRYKRSPSKEILRLLKAIFQPIQYFQLMSAPGGAVAVIRVAICGMMR